jgi:dTMP kinase
MALKGRLTRGDNDDVDSSIDEVSMALFFAADRMDHVSTEIAPKLSQGVHVVCDRYYLSSIAYQSSKLDSEWIYQINRFALIPDLTILLDVPADECLRRMASSRWRRERYERPEALKTARTAFLLAAEQLRNRGDRIEILDGCRHPNEIHEQIKNMVASLLALPASPEAVRCVTQPI